MTARQRIGFVALGLYVFSIFAANYFIQHDVIGHQAFPGGPYVIPVGPWEAPAGTVWIGAALVFRDVLQKTLGRRWALGAIAAGAVLSYFVTPSLAWASMVAFGLGELADFAVYTPLSERRLYLAVFLSGVVGAFVDTFIFLQLAFHSIDFWQGTVVAKCLMSVAALPFLFAWRRWEGRAVSHDTVDARYP